MDQPAAGSWDLESLPETSPLAPVGQPQQGLPPIPHVELNDPAEDSTPPKKDGDVLRRLQRCFDDVRLMVFLYRTYF